MTLQLKVEGSIPPGVEKFVPVQGNGFPSRGLEALHLFEDGTGTASASVTGSGAGLVEHPVATNNAYAWLTGGGGIELSGTEIVSFPEFSVITPWTLVVLGAIVDSVGGTGSERITGVLGFRNFTGNMTGGYRGALLLARGGNSWATTSTSVLWQVRAADGIGGPGTSTPLSPASNLTILDRRFVTVMSYDGSSDLRTATYDGDSALVSEMVLEVSDAQLTTGTGDAVDTTLQPIIGGPSNVYSGGKQQIEAFARWSRVLSERDVEAVVKAGVALGDARGRAW